MGASRDEEQATQEVADYLRRQDWNTDRYDNPGDAALNAFWVSRAEDVLDAVAEAGAKLFGGDLSLDDDEIDVLRARIDHCVRDCAGYQQDLLVEQLLDAVKGFINGQVV